MTKNSPSGKISALRYYLAPKVQFGSYFETRGPPWGCFFVLDALSERLVLNVLTQFLAQEVWTVPQRTTKCSIWTIRVSIFRAPVSGYKTPLSHRYQARAHNWMLKLTERCAIALTYLSFGWHSSMYTCFESGSTVFLNYSTRKNPAINMLVILCNRFYCNNLHVFYL